MESLDKALESSLKTAIDEYRKFIGILDHVSERIVKLGKPPALPSDALIDARPLLQNIERDINHQIELLCPNMPASYRSELTSLAEDPFRLRQGTHVDIDSLKISYYPRIRVLENMLEWLKANCGKRSRAIKRKGLMPFPVPENEIDRLSMTFVESDGEILKLKFGRKLEERTPMQAGFANLCQPTANIIEWKTLREFAKGKGRLKNIDKADVSVLNRSLKALFTMSKRPIIFNYDSRQYETLFDCQFISASRARQ